jgi:hypothetical protein
MSRWKRPGWACESPGPPRTGACGLAKLANQASPLSSRYLWETIGAELVDGVGSDLVEELREPSLGWLQATPCPQATSLRLSDRNYGLPPIRCCAGRVLSFRASASVRMGR